MKIAETKKALQESIDSGDEQLLQILHYTANTYKRQHEKPYELTDWQKEELDTPSTVNEPNITWEEAKRKIRANHIAKYPNGNSNKD